MAVAKWIENTPLPPTSMAYLVAIQVAVSPTMGKLWLWLLCIILSSSGVAEGAPYLRTVNEEATTECTFQLDPFSLIYTTNNNSSCELGQEQLIRVTKNHIIAFFDSEDEFMDVSLVTTIKHEEPFACEDETTMTFTGSVTCVSSESADSRTMDELLSYLYHTRHSYTGFLRELGWENLVSVSILTESGDIMGAPVALADGPEKESENNSPNTGILIVAIAVPCSVIFACIFAFLVCRKRGCMGAGDLEREEQRGNEMSSSQIEEATMSKTERVEDAAMSSSTESGSSTTHEEASIPLDHEAKARNNNLIESTVTVATGDMSSVSLSRILGNGGDSFSFCSSSSCAEPKPRNGTERSHSRQLSAAKDEASEGLEKHVRALSPMSECRGMRKKPTIYRYLEAKLSSTPKQEKTRVGADQAWKKSPSQKDHGAVPQVTSKSLKPKDSREVTNENLSKSPLGRYVNSAKDFDNVKHESTLSYVPSFMMSFGSALSLSSGASVSSTSAISVEKKNFAISGIERIKTSGDYDDKSTCSKARSTKSEASKSQAKSHAKSEANKSRAGSVHRRYSFARKKQLVKEDVEPIAHEDEGTSEHAVVPMTRVLSHTSQGISVKDNDCQLDEQASIDPILSVSAPGSQNSLSSKENPDPSISDSVDENASDYSPPERTYFFGKD